MRCDLFYFLLVKEKNFLKISDFYHFFIDMQFLPCNLFYLLLFITARVEVRTRFEADSDGNLNVKNI